MEVNGKASALFTVRLGFVTCLLGFPRYRQLNYLANIYYMFSLKLLEVLDS